MVSDLNSNANNLVEILLVSVFSVDRLMFLNISLTVLKISKPSFSESILINLRPSSCATAFCLLISQSIFLTLCPFQSISIASL